MAADPPAAGPNTGGYPQLGGGPGQPGAPPPPGGPMMMKPSQANVPPCPMCGSRSPPVVTYETNCLGLIWACICLFLPCGCICSICIFCTHSPDSFHEPKKKCAGCGYTLLATPLLQQ